MPEMAVQGAILNDFARKNASFAKAGYDLA
jgi:hypothetical protein